MLNWIAEAVLPRAAEVDAFSAARSAYSAIRKNTQTNILMTTSERLNQLFDRWQSSSPEHMHTFVRDGIINEDKFHPKRVLFLCKEPNQSRAQEDVPTTRIWDFREWWKEPLWGTFSIALGTWAYGVLSDFIPYDDISHFDCHNAIQSVAFMNIKKTGGLGQSVSKDLYKYVSTYKEFIEEQINIIRPSVIVASINCRQFSGLLFHNSERHGSGHGIDIIEWNGIPIIDFYHPSVRGGVCLSYALLKTVMAGQVFQELVNRRNSNLSVA